MQNFLTNLSAKVRAMRKQQGLSQTRLAQKAGLDYRYIGFLEQGRLNPTLKTLDKVAKALKTDLCGLCPSPDKRKTRPTKPTVKQQAISRINARLHNSTARQIAKIEKMIRIMEK